jgi:CP family cyanate transporter-like MFS transporter
MGASNSHGSLFLLWTCGASLRLTVLAVPPVISIIQQDLHLSGTEVGLLSGVPVMVFATVATPAQLRTLGSFIWRASS